MPTIRGIVIPADPSKDIYLEEFEKGNRDQQQWLVAGKIRSVKLANPDCVLYVNQSSPSPGYRANERATLILHTHKPASIGHDAVTGDAFILGPANTDVPPELIQTFIEHAKLRVEAQFTDDAPWVRRVADYASWQLAYTDAVETVRIWEKVKGVRVVPA